MKKIIAVQGFKGSGKDETAKFLNYLLNSPSWMHNYQIAKLLNFKTISNKWKITRYADSLKKILAILMNIDIKKFEDRAFKEYCYFDFNSYTLLDSSKEKVIRTITDKAFNKEIKKENLKLALEHNLTIRQILQFFGTDVMRKFFGNKLWIHTTLNIKENNLIIADQRFCIENQILTNSNTNHLIIHIIRPGCEPGLHASEKELEELLNNKQYDVLLENNGTLENLFNKCKNLVYNFIW